MMPGIRLLYKNICILSLPSIATQSWYIQSSTCRHVETEEDGHAAGEEGGVEQREESILQYT